MPCGHNGCLHCLQSVQFRNSQCPLCRSPFDPATQLVCNHELRDLIAMATSGMYVDEKTKSDGWEAFPTARLASECYATEFKHHRQQGRCDDVSVTEPSAPLMLAEHMPQYNHHGGNSSGGSSRGGSGELALGLEPDMGLLQLEAPHWLPDSYASSCSACHQPFRALLRLRHHCRMCGKIFCHTCCKRKLLLPPKYGQRTRSARARCVRACCSRCSRTWRAR